MGERCEVEESPARKGCGMTEGGAGQEEVDLRPQGSGCTHGHLTADAPNCSMWRILLTGLC